MTTTRSRAEAAVIPGGDRALHLTSNIDMEGSDVPVSKEQAPAIAQHLAEEDLQELRVGIQRSLCTGEMRDSSAQDVDDELRKSLRVACAKARLQRVRAEHLVIDLKKIWRMIPTRPVTRTESALSPIITACINEYYKMDDLAQS